MPYIFIGTFWGFVKLLGYTSSDLSENQLENSAAVAGKYGCDWVDENKADDIPKEELDKLYNSKTNTLYALPQAISLCVQKRV